MPGLLAWVTEPLRKYLHRDHAMSSRQSLRTRGMMIPIADSSSKPQGKVRKTPARHSARSRLGIRDDFLESLATGDWSISVGRWPGFSLRFCLVALTSVPREDENGLCRLLICR
jgi:hypothetical protein